MYFDKISVEEYLNIMFYVVLFLWYKILKESFKEKKLCKNLKIVFFCIVWLYRIFK